MTIVPVKASLSDDPFQMAGRVPRNTWSRMLSGPRLRPQDPKAVALKEKFEDALAAAEQLMIQRNADSGSRARHSPAGIPYRLMYPSSKTDPPTLENQGMTGCGIP